MNSITEKKGFSNPYNFLGIATCTTLSLIDVMPFLYGLTSKDGINFSDSLGIFLTLANILALILFSIFLLRKCDKHIYRALLYCNILSLGLLTFAFPNITLAPPYLFIESFLLSFLFLISLSVLGKFSIISNACIGAFFVMIGLMWHVIKTPFNLTTAGQIFGADTNDIINFISIQTTLFIAVTIGICILAFYCLYTISKKSGKKACFICSLSLFILSFSHIASHPDALYKLPHGARNFGMRGALKALHGSVYFKVKYKKRIDSLAPIQQSPLNINTLKGDEGLVLILHFGEELSANHLSINGYHRDTTPFLSKCDNLINFRDCVAAAPLTYKSHIAMITNAQGNFDEDISEELMPTSGSFLDALTFCTFKLYMMETNGRPDLKASGWLDYIMIKLHPHGDFSLSTRQQNAQKENIKKILSRAEKNNICISINNDGSHFNYFNYNKETAPFSPSDPQAYYHRPDINPKEAEKVVNAYDNTIFETDVFIKDVVQQLEGRPYLYIYMSDHGTCISHEDGWSRQTDMKTFFRTSSCQVPFFCIASEAFIRLHPHFQEAISNLKRNTSMTVSHAHLFHTVLGIFGIKSPYYDEELDLSSDKARPYAGPHPSREGKATDGKKWY